MRKRWLRRLGIMTIIIFLGTLILSCVLGVIIVRYGDVDRAETADVIVVLGAGNRWVIRRRAGHGAELWQKGLADYIICTGGDTMHQRYAESEICRDKLISEGVPEGVIFIETESRSTEENAIQARKIMEAQNWQTAILVSDNYHLWRAQLIFSQRWAEDWKVFTSPAQATQDDGDMPRGWGRSMMREVLATYWFVGKSLLGLPYTDFPQGFYYTPRPN